MQTIHGVAISIYSSGVLLLGASSIGKSELALELVSRGHKLIADDAICVTKDNGCLILASDLEKSMLYLRGIGFLDIETLYGKDSTQKSSPLNLIIQLTHTNIERIDPLAQLIGVENILEVPITKFELPISNNRPLALLVEVIVKYAQQRELNNDSNNEFINQHLAELQS